MTLEERFAHRDYLRPELERLGSAHETSWILDFVAQKKELDFAQQRARLGEILERKAKGEPLAYIFGSWSFRGHEILLSRDTLIPRPETEELVEAVIMSLENSYLSSEKILKEGFRLADLGAGSGCIGLVTIADLLRDIQTETGNALEISGRFELFLVEQSTGACEVIKKNVAALKPLLLNTKIHVVCTSWNEFSERNLDVIVSNPPYITPEEYENLDKSVRDFEPRAALFCPDALSCYREIATLAKKALVDRGWLFLELGVAQGELVQQYFSGDPAFNEIRTLKDIAKKPRFFCARRTGVKEHG